MVLNSVFTDRLLKQKYTLYCVCFVESFRKLSFSFILEFY